MLNFPDVLLVVFRRPDSTKKILDYLVFVGVRRIYVSVDAPRPSVKGESELVSDVLRLLDDYSEKIEIIRRVAARNQGAGLGVFSAISWFLSQVSSGVIIEDDCLPGVGFLDYCAAALDKFRNNGDVAFISGGQFKWGLDNKCVYSTNVPLTWGWATWSDRWNGFDRSLLGISFLERLKVIRRQHFGFLATVYFILLFKLADQNKIDAWDVQWCFFNWRLKRHSIAPPVNLINYLGVDNFATHTSKEAHLNDMRSSDIDLEALSFDDVQALDDLFVVKRVHHVSDLIKIVRMAISVCVSKRVFYFIRRMFR